MTETQDVVCLTIEERCRLIICREQGGDKLFAHLTRARKIEHPFMYTLAITCGHDLRDTIGTVRALNKRHARELCRRFNATPWNF